MRFVRAVFVRSQIYVCVPGTQLQDRAHEIGVRESRNPRDFPRPKRQPLSLSFRQCLTTLPARQNTMKVRPRAPRRSISPRPFQAPLILLFAALSSATDHPQLRIKGHKTGRPCGRTFLDWSVEFVNVNYNYNYNCGGGAPGGHLQGGGIGSHLQGGNLVSHFASHRPQNGGAGGPLGLGLLPLLFGTASSSSSSGGVVSPPVRPGEVPQDEVVPDRNRLRPGSYVTASNPLFGSYSYEIGSFKGSRLLGRVDKTIDRLLDPLYYFL